MYTIHVSVADGDQKWARNPLEVGLEWSCAAMWFWELNPGPLQEKQKLLITEHLASSHMSIALTLQVREVHFHDK